MFATMIEIQELICNLLSSGLKESGWAARVAALHCVS